MLNGECSVALMSELLVQVKQKFNCDLSFCLALFVTRDPKSTWVLKSNWATRTVLNTNSYTLEVHCSILATLATPNEIGDATNLQLRLDMCLAKWPHSNCSLARVTSFPLACGQWNESLHVAYRMSSMSLLNKWFSPLMLLQEHKYWPGLAWYPKFGQVGTFIFGKWFTYGRSFGAFSLLCFFTPCSL